MTHMEDYLSARMITTPFGLYDCDVPCDGAVAAVVSAVDAAARPGRTPVRIEAVGTQIIERTDWDQTTLTHEPQVLGQSAHLWSRTSLRPSDVDVAELWATGSPSTACPGSGRSGFCGIGEARISSTAVIQHRPETVLPLNTHGGQLSTAAPTGWA